jgi:hypothetical protein
MGHGRESVNCLKGEGSSTLAVAGGVRAGGRDRGRGGAESANYASVSNWRIKGISSLLYPHHASFLTPGVSSLLLLGGGTHVEETASCAVFKDAQGYLELLPDG